jgi:hypothetical protein
VLIQYAPSTSAFLRLFCSLVLTRLLATAELMQPLRESRSSIVCHAELGGTAQIANRVDSSHRSPRPCPLARASVLPVLTHVPNGLQSSGACLEVRSF